jgi:hypothetical protein
MAWCLVKAQGQLYLYLYILLTGKCIPTLVLKKFPCFYVTRSFMTTFANSSHLARLANRCILSAPPHPVFRRSILILSSHRTKKKNYGKGQGRVTQPVWIVGCGLNHRGSVPGRDSDGIFFSSPQRPDRLWGHPVSYPMGSGAFSPGVKRLGREADHSPSSKAEVTNAWSYTSIPDTPS